MNEHTKSQYLIGNRYLNRHRIVGNMETFQDLIMIFLCIGLLGVMVAQLFSMFSSLLQPVDFKQVTAQILFLLILVELFRLLVVYLQEHSVEVDVALEVTIVSVLREIIVKGVLEISCRQLLATCSLLLILGVLLMVCVKTPLADRKKQ